MAQTIMKDFPELDACIGGQISIDIYPKGNDKSQASKWVAKNLKKEMAFFDSKLGPLNVLKPPIARVPEAFGELLTGNVEDFTNYTMYTMLPFGRGIRQIKQLADDRPKRGLERAPEILLRLPNQQVRSRIKRMKDENRKRREIKEYLN